MIFLPIENVLPGMVLDKDIIANGARLLSRGIELSESLISNLKEKGVQGCYIQSEQEDTIEEEVAAAPLEFEHSYKSMIDFKSLAAAKDLVKSPKVLKHSLFPVITEVVNKSTEWINSLDDVEIDDNILERSVNTSILAVGLGAALDLTTEELLSIGYGSIFSDFGMLLVAEDIRNKKGSLTTAEYEIIQTHCRKGLNYVRKNLNLPLSTYQTILDHHERWDGSGYPEGRKKENISKYARIVMIADVYDALTRPNAYRQAFMPHEAIECIMGGSGVLFDPKFAKEFVDNITPYPVGASVQLSDGSLGIVCSIKSNKKRPIVKLYGKGSKLLSKPLLINLNDNKHLNLTITKITGFQPIGSKEA